MLAVAMGATLISAQWTVRDAEAETTAEQIRGDQLILPAGTPGLPREVLQTPALQDAEAASGVTSTIVYLPGDTPTDPAEPAAAWGVDPQTIGDVFALDLARGDLGRLDSQSVVMERSVVPSGAGLGDSVEVYLGDRTQVTLTLVAVVEDAPTEVVLVSDLLAPHLADDLLQTIYVRGADPAAVTELASTYPGVAVTSRAAYVDSLTTGGVLVALAATLLPAGLTLRRPPTLAS